MRRLNVASKKQALKVVKELDAFPKIPESYVETTATGGGISIVTFFFIGVLVLSEIRYHADTELKYDYQVDSDSDSKLKINIDMTVAMRCSAIGADVLDLTGTNAKTFGKLEEYPVEFEMNPEQRTAWNVKQHFNEYIRNEYHAIHKLLWRNGYQSMGQDLPQSVRKYASTQQQVILGNNFVVMFGGGEKRPDGEPNGCRLVGTLTVNKVAGNFHITAGKHVPEFGGGHAHLAAMIDRSEYNFSHRINHFSFGEPTAGVINPLDGDEQISPNLYHMFQYFVQVVPTKVNTYASKIDTYQYAVTEKNRTIDHSKGSHGVPGIFVKYDMSSFTVKVTEEHKPLWQFLVRLCGIVGGVFATSGILHSVVGLVVDVLCCRYKLGKYKPVNNDNFSQPSSPTTLLENPFPGERLPTVGLVQPGSTVEQQS